MKKSKRKKTNRSDQEQHKQHKDQQNNNNWETVKERKTTVRIFQATNWRNLTREDLDKVEEVKLY